MPHEPKTGIYYEVHGQGVPVVIGHPHHVSVDKSLSGYLERLTDRYCVVVMDYPSLGKSPSIPTAEFTVDRSCSDILHVADAVGFERFVWWGYSWGGVIGLQLASRTGRLSGVICGGWPPLGGQYSEILRGVRAWAANPLPDDPSSPEDRSRAITFYESIKDWPEYDAVSKITCPRMTYVGTDDTVDIGGVEVEIGPPVHEKRNELERLGWLVVEVPGRDHTLCTDFATVAPICRDFLDESNGW